MAAAPAPSRALAALGLAVGEATARLPEDARTALELRELDGVSYFEIGATLGCSEPAVAELLVRARLELCSSVRGVEAQSQTSPDCARARPLLAARQDGELTDTAGAAWLRAHVEGCQSCPSTRLAMREATIALRGAQRADGAAVAMPEPIVVAPLPVIEPEQPAPFEPIPPTVPGSEPPPSALAAPAQLVVGSRPAARRRRLVAMLATVGTVVAAGFAVAAIAGRDDPPSATRAPAAPAAPQDSGTAPVSTVDSAAAERRRRAADRRRRAAAARRRRANATPTPASSQPSAPAPSTPATGGEEDEDAAAERPSRTPAPSSGDAETEVGEEEGDAGLPSSDPQPTTGGQPGGGVTDSCNEESPDCDSG